MEAERERERGKAEHWGTYLCHGGNVQFQRVWILSYNLCCYICLVINTEQAESMDLRAKDILNAMWQRSESAKLGPNNTSLFYWISLSPAPPPPPSLPYWICASFWSTKRREQEDEDNNKQIQVSDEDNNKEKQVPEDYNNKKNGKTRLRQGKQHREAKNKHTIYCSLQPMNNSNATTT